MMKAWIKYIQLVLIAGVFIVGVAWGGIVYYMHQPLFKKEQVIMIPRGASLNAVASMLNKQFHFHYASLWSLYGRVTGWSRRLNAGEYAIPAGSSGKDLLILFASGNVVQHRLTFVAGMTVQEVLTLMENQPKLIDDIKGLSGEALLKYLGITAVSPEGLFYPDTYFYTAGSKASSILLKAHDVLQSTLVQAWKNREKGLPYKRSYDALIMASMIEKETGAPEERAEIAGVFVRRLEKGMRLQSDPTVIYGMGNRFQGKLTRKDLREKTPYNTYRIDGLPPTPISLVNRVDIDAALHPLRGVSLYFVATGDGTHVFSNTLAEQRKAIKQYQLKRKKGYRSFPAEAGMRAEKRMKGENK